MSQTAAAHPAAELAGACKAPPHKDSTRIIDPILSCIRMPFIPAAAGCGVLHLKLIKHKRHCAIYNLRTFRTTS